MFDIRVSELLRSLSAMPLSFLGIGCSNTNKSTNSNVIVNELEHNNNMATTASAFRGASTAASQPQRQLQDRAASSTGSGTGVAGTHLPYDAFTMMMFFVWFFAVIIIIWV